MFKPPVYAITDVETGGLSEHKNALTQVSIILANADFEIVEIFAHKIQPRQGYVVDPRAAEVNGYNEEEWKAFGMEPDLADASFSTFLSQAFKGGYAVGVAHNAPFDAKFVRHHMPQTYAKYLAIGGPDRKAHDGWYCTLSGVRKYRDRVKIAGSNKLSDLAELAGYTPEGKTHDALTDTKTCLAGLKWLREHAQDTFAGLNV